MKRRHGARAMAIAVGLLTISGCATVMTLGEQETKNKVFSGTIRHVELKCAHAVCVDMPFSLVADTVLLPVTIPWTGYNFINVHENRRSTEPKPRE